MRRATQPVPVLSSLVPKLDKETFANPTVLTLYTFVCDCGTRRAVSGPLYPNLQQEDMIEGQKQGIRATCPDCKKKFG